MSSTTEIIKRLKRKTAIYTELPKILVVKKEVAEASWNKHLPIPLMIEEKVILVSLEKPKKIGVMNYVKVRHGKGSNKTVSVFCLHNFLDLRGRNVKLKHN